ncbi:MAG: translation initiation factor IF-3 [Clostridia bacterium]|nr:translation initiation factor IF-3 [Clostridia bacterium]MEE1184734.1 translation initiation factor IF-3 [Acutalibacteraceae bacterium]
MLICTNVLRSCFCFYLPNNRRCIIISSKELATNEEIKFKEVRVINSDGSQLGVLPIEKAIEAAYAQDLDLVNISPNAQPPVCKIMDYGKYRFEQAKREKEQRKNQKVVEVKEIRLGLSIDVHDFETKGKHARRFLEDGNKVKVSIRFRGRELGHPEIGLETMSRFADFCKDFCVVEKAAKMEGRNMLMFLAPKTGK